MAPKEDPPGQFAAPQRPGLTTRGVIILTSRTCVRVRRCIPALDAETGIRGIQPFHRNDLSDGPVWSSH
jgi:hypothetical protein